MVIVRENVLPKTEREARDLIDRLVWDRKGRLRGRVTNVTFEDGRLQIEIRKLSRVPG